MSLARCPDTSLMGSLFFPSISPRSLRKTRFRGKATQGSMDKDPASLPLHQIGSPEKQQPKNDCRVRQYHHFSYRAAKLSLGSKIIFFANYKPPRQICKYISAQRSLFKLLLCFQEVWRHEANEPFRFLVSAFLHW